MLAGLAVTTTLGMKVAVTVPDAVTVIVVLAEVLLAKVIPAVPLHDLKAYPDPTVAAA
jgi:hypothetical protein